MGIRDVGRRRQMIDAVRQGIGNRPAQRGGLEDDVGVGEQQPFAVRAIGAELQGVVLSQPARPAAPSDARR